MGFVDFLLWALWLWLVVVCIWIFIWILIDIFRDHTLNGWAKTGWVIVLVILPLLGALIYLITRGGSMAARQTERVKESQQASAEYIRAVAGSASPAEEIARAQELLVAGAITQVEFDAIKAKALA